MEQVEVNRWLRFMSKEAKVRGDRFDYWQIESGSTAIGIPDLYVCLNNKSGWIECKEAKNTPDCYKFASVSFRPGQLRAINKLRQHGQNASVLILCGATLRCSFAKQDFKILTIPADTITRRVDVIGWVDYCDSYDQLCEWLGETHEIREEDNYGIVDDTQYTEEEIDDFDFSGYEEDYAEQWGEQDGLPDGESDL